jgi:hypothetical protein
VVVHSDGIVGGGSATAGCLLAPWVVAGVGAKGEWQQLYHTCMSSLGVWEGERLPQATV